MAGVYGANRKVYAVGYRPYETHLPNPTSKVVPASVDLHLKRPRRSRNFRRLNFGAIPGYGPISVDRRDPETLRRALAKRVGRDLPKPDPARIKLFREFVRQWVRKHVPVVDVPTFDEWLEAAPYTLARKAELRRAYEQLRGLPPTPRQCSHVDSFAKLESYPEFKEARWINSRSDAFKVYSGPAFHAIESVLYKLPYFIKHVPVPERPALVRALKRVGLRYYENDYTAFESHFTPEFLRMCECVLYEHALQRDPELARVICQTISGTNRLRTKSGVGLTLEGRRMSGDMCTSLGNGFTNLMLALFIAHEAGGHLDGFVEGDDGLFAVDFEMTSEMFSGLGFTVKIKEHSDPCHAHFCGMTMTADGTIIKDPRRVFQTFGWTHSFIGAGHRVMDELLRSKALSLAYELPQCPVIGQLSRTALELTEGCGVREELGIYRRAPRVYTPPPFRPTADARTMLQEHFGISIETQLAAEEAIRGHDLLKVAALIPPLLDPFADSAPHGCCSNLEYVNAYLEIG